MRRCSWAKSPLSIAYHDNEWGVPQRDDRRLFEFLVLEGAQAGLSWETILRKRENFRRAFDNFDTGVIARYDEVKVSELLADPGIIRNRLKILSVIGNARAFIRVQNEYGSFDAYIWQFVGGRSLRNSWQSPDIPTHTALSDKMSKELKLRGFRFVGTTICYSFMQAVGMVNDHEEVCFRYREIG